MSQIQNLFSTPIQEVFIDEEITKKVQDIVLPRLDKLANLDTEIYSNPTGTDYFIERIFKPEDYEEFFDLMAKHGSEFCKQIGFQTGPRMNWWVQDYRQGGKHRRHNHGASRVSGVFWIRANEAAGDLVLENPNAAFQYLDHSEINPLGEYTKVHHFIKPATGKLVLFPSYINHEASESLTGVERTIFAFNLDL